ncbi:hypothetical protein FKM82_028089 [Ascaphus truei]
MYKFPRLVRPLLTRAMGPPWCRGPAIVGVMQSVPCFLLDADIKRTSSGRSAPSSESISHYFLHSNSAEAVAMGLLKQFEGMQLPAASELEWLVPEDDAPQKVCVCVCVCPVSFTAAIRLYYSAQKINIPV